MRHCLSVIFILFLLVFASCAWAQETDRSSKSDLLVRLSYETSAGAELQQVCLAVSRDGEYRIVRSMPNALTTRMQGKMPEEQLQQLTKLLASPEFKKLTGNHGGLIRQDAESFAAEIPLGTRMLADGTREWFEPKAQRVQWLNADGESPFPDSIAKVVDWLEHFQPKEGKPFEYAEFPSVCPAGGLRFVQPTVAFNHLP